MKPSSFTSLALKGLISWLKTKKFIFNLFFICLMILMLSKKICSYLFSKPCHVLHFLAFKALCSYMVRWYKKTCMAHVKQQKSTQNNVLKEFEIFEIKLTCNRIIAQIHYIKYCYKSPLRNPSNSFLSSQSCENLILF